MSKINRNQKFYAPRKDAFAGDPRMRGYTAPEMPCLYKVGDTLNAWGTVLTIIQIERDYYPPIEPGGKPLSNTYMLTVRAETGIVYQLNQEEAMEELND